jgi:hypothetical protein
MAKEITLTNSTKKAIIDDSDFDYINAQNWFLDNGHPYTKIMIPIEDNPFHKSYALKIRMDHYLLGLTTYNFVDIRHPLRDRLDNRVSKMWLEHTPKARKTRGMTKYLGVKSTKGYIVAEYRFKDGTIYKSQDYHISSTVDEITRKEIERRAAEQYDEWAREIEGYEAKTNFLPKSLLKYHIRL